MLENKCNTEGIREERIDGTDPECGMNSDDRQFPEHRFGKAISHNTQMQTQTHSWDYMIEVP